MAQEEKDTQSAAVMLRSLLNGSTVTVDGEPHRLVSVSRLVELGNDVDFLNCLYAAGVDNWEGHDEARRAYHEQHTEEAP